MPCGCRRRRWRAMLGSLGESLATIVPKHLAGHTDLVGFDANLLSEYDGDSTVRWFRTVVPGGDPGTGHAGWTIHLNESSIKRLLETGRREHREATLGSRQSGWVALPRAGIVALRHALSTHRLGIPPHAVASLPARRTRVKTSSLASALQRWSPPSRLYSMKLGRVITPPHGEERAERGNLTPLSVTLSTSLLGNSLGRGTR